MRITPFDHESANLDLDKRNIHIVRVRLFKDGQRWFGLD